MTPHYLSEQPDPSRIRALAALIRPECRLTILTGAGISADSGIGTFRDAEAGYWAQFDPRDLATESGFIAHPERVWSWYQWRREQIRNASPNPGHRSIVSLRDRVQSLTLLTQNVDGLHQRAGSQDVIELHGNIMRSKCHLTQFEVAEQIWHPGTAYVQGPPPPSGHHPDGLVRPDVVWFGESLSQSRIEQAIQASCHSDLFLSIGTSSVVEPAASLALLAKSHGACVAEINPEDTPLSARCDLIIRAGAAVTLEALMAQLQTH